MQKYQIGSTEWIKQELAGLLGEQVTRDIQDSIRLYAVYDGDGQIWQPNTEGLDYKPSVKITNIVKKLIKEEARFMMGVEPEIKIQPMDGEIDAERKSCAQIEDWLSDFLRRNKWGDKLIKGARDCFIGKRVALKLTGAPGRPLGVQFRPSLEFVYETDPEDVDRLIKVVFFYHTNESMDRDKQRIWRQKYEMKDGRCVLTEGVYDGNGRPVDETHREEDTGLDFIPVYIIINDGLTGDMTGESDVRELLGNQDSYNRLRSDDLDALRFNMFPMRLFRDASQETMDAVKIAPGAVVDAQTDPASGSQVDAKILETQFGYDARIEHTLDRTKSDMYEALSVPNVSPDQLKNFVTSGKTMKALYWGLTCRCEEKWNAWDAALIWMVDALLRMAKAYGAAVLPEARYTVSIDHRYPIPDDEETERQNDMSEVAQQVRSHKSYIEKWQPEADSSTELEQIIREQRSLGDEYQAGLNMELEQSDTK